MFFSPDMVAKQGTNTQAKQERYKEDKKQMISKIA